VQSGASSVNQCFAAKGWPDMNIRPATVDDAPALARVHVDSWCAAYGELVPESFLQGFRYQGREERFRESLAEGAEETYVVQSDQEIVGFLTLGPARDPDLDVRRIGEIWGIYVSPDFWRRGIGKELAEEAERILKSRGYEHAVLWVLEGNQRARRFYEAMGFSLDGEFKNIDWGIPLKAVRYRKAL
jgi:ribosomal protein S18 acetylase RimI-like enzyme